MGGLVRGSFLGVDEHPAEAGLARLVEDVDRLREIGAGIAVDVEVVIQIPAVLAHQTKAQ